MATKFALFICLMITFIFSCSSETTASGTINWWCTQTPHYETCNHLVAQRYPTTGPISINQFLDITIQAAMDDARVVLKRAQEIESEYPNVPGKSLWASCVDYFDGIVFTLNMVLDHTLQPTPLDVQTWLSAGLAYINVCEKGFEFINVSNHMLPVISTNLTELILNALAISVVIKGGNSNYTHGIVECTLPDLAVEKADVVVAKDGSGNFKTVQEAVNSVGNRRRNGRYVIYVKAGIYEENVMIPKTVPYVKMFGDGINKTIITGSRYVGGDMLETPLAGDLKDSATFQVWGRGFVARDITFRNTAGSLVGPAVALLSGADQSAFYHCSIEGYQDTLFTFSGKQFYKECQIFGTVYFIFGDALAVFQDCKIFLRKPHPGGGLVVTANGRRYYNESTGYSLQGCKIKAAVDLGKIKAFLGRPWFPYGLAVYMQSFFDNLVDPKGWVDSWGFNKTSYCGEYKNYGPGSSTGQRVKWRGYHAITDKKIAECFTVNNFMSGNQWLPGSGVPFTPGFEKSVSMN
ncbi:hypothetical protein L2E82_31798 [Cichorium intybus]|uniref:Uncharacterized protein n=1 Tax=Cichorium intybus TaxID=13427 RepID=A0ACB9BFU2_CICIN|nr:hypothetical protein L2E82_31798 [Cichorium intybus]